MYQRGGSLLILAGFAALFCQPAAAADLPSVKAPPSAPPAAFTWTGLYIGADFGYTWSPSRSINAVSANIYDKSFAGWGAASALSASGVVNSNLDGFFTGGGIGYNWQFADRWVARIEADLQGYGVRGGGGLANYVPAPTPAFFAVTGAKLNRNLEYFGTVRGALGYTVLPNLLVYATGGLAYGGINESATFGQNLVPSLFPSDTAKGASFENRAGWTAGVGVEYALTRNLSAKLEYLYYDLGSMGLTNANISPISFQGALMGAQRVADATSVSTRFDGHVVRAGLNYRFDWSEPQTAGSGATPLLAEPKFAAAPAPAFGDWNVLLTQYTWAMGLNGNVTAKGQTLGVDYSFIDFLDKVSTFPLAFSGRIDASNGPVSFYGDLIWMQMRTSGSSTQLRSPFAEIGVAANADTRTKLTLAIAEVGAGYEVARWKFFGAPNSFTALDAYAGLRYWFLNTNMRLDIVGAANAQLLGLDQLGAWAIAKSGDIQWIDPVIGGRLRHEFAPGEQFQLRGDIGGFGAGSKFSWQVYGGYSHDFEFCGLKLTSSIGYRALSVDYSQTIKGQPSGLNAILHGPVTSISLRL
ncbi:outer membrane protein [Methylocystis heyeri]|uniref:Outer membrane beta-barrel protein n=1 Tax=Methylocystis heyeri TaxID=391905 RepID=A0A6B8KF12_9HYPH|nr:outer membrane beta-barrel protein [Methylocystis heyeri]QGM45621.1 outer membrane beta-barrel protein [Methylocystis heyeri]